MLLATRGLIAVASVLIAFGAWLVSSFVGGGASPAFGEVLAKIREAKTLHLQLVRGETTHEIWVRQPAQLRREIGPQKYHVVQGSKLWQVDEAENRVASSRSSYFGEDGKTVDLLALLDVSPEAARLGELFQEQAADQTKFKGKTFDVYRAEVTTAAGPAALEALVEPDTHRLRWLVAKRRQDDQWKTFGELRVLAYNPPVDEEKFLVADSLTEDGRIGKVADSQGLITIRPVLSRRWTPVCRQMLLRPGDWVRTDIRGANAVALQLTSGSELTLGPGSLVELISPKEIRVHAGQLQVSTREQHSVTVRAAEASVRVAESESKVLRRVGDKLVALKDKPQWLLGFEGATTQESLGSLVALVDGRNVPLTVGYHKVTVDIRDQIARTTIEESFVNHTNQRLEGVFHFPLPPDASISGFGMWIGDELVEADVVEKQRAREIYETILREKRDPGLLEWTGGNIFKARVFPIFPHSEKRIKITYTQVLPLRGNRYRYNYGLQSEMLRKTPLRELSLDVTLHSALPLRSVDCPTHDVRTEQTAHSAHVEFAAQEFTPDRDFEVVFEIGGGQSDVVLIPHRRGEDGYFLMQLTPPAPDGQWQRELLPDGAPLEVLLVADTSASMDETKRTQQAEFIAAVLASLGEDDRFNLAVCDVECQWMFATPQAVTADNAAAARKLLDERVSLGWTDLESAFQSVLAHSGPGTHVVYVGDGIVTAHGADPAEFVNRLQRMHGKNDGTVHAVTVGNSYESVVLKAVAALGGGSLRRITGEQPPHAVALELLNELAQPGLKDVNVEFRGLRVAAVYPEVLPNVPAGSQQILLGRYLPSGSDQTGEVIVTGTLRGKPVEYRSRVSLKDAEAGNSFIPRLWARMHLDALLAQGSSPAIQEEIVALSEEYNIITPYTSLLVLETDADRERFGVKRRYRMRDGEKFFAEGRDTANYELVQQQMRQAGTWRIGLRRQILAQLAELGRSPALLPSQQDLQRLSSVLSKKDQIFNEWSSEPIDFGGWGGGGVGGGGGAGGGFGGISFFNGSVPFPVSGPVSHSFDEFAESSQFGNTLSLVVNQTQDVWDGAKLEPFEELADREDDRIYGLDKSTEELRAWNADGLDSQLASESNFAWGPSSHRSGPMRMSGGFGRSLMDLRVGAKQRIDSKPGAYEPSFKRLNHFAGGQYLGWIDQLFPPMLPAPASTSELRPPMWSPEAYELSRSLLRSQSLRQLEGGLDIRRVTEYADPRWQTVSSRSEQRELITADAWLTRPNGVGTHTVIQWCDAKERGTYSRAFQLGRVRESTEADRTQPPLSVLDYSLSALHENYAEYRATIKPQAADRVRLVLSPSWNPENETRVLIDTARHVVLEVVTVQDGNATAKTIFGDFVEHAGRWWAKTIEYRDAQDRRTGRVTQTLTALTAEEFDKAFTAELADRDAVQFVQLPLPTVADARVSFEQDTADFNDHFALLLHFTLSQQWEQVREQLTAAEKIAADKPGLRWIRDAVRQISRRNEELKARLFAEAERLAAAELVDDWHLANYLWGQATAILQANEQLRLLDALRPVYDRQPPYVHATKHWRGLRANLLVQAGRVDEARELRRQLAVEHPHDTSLQTQYAQMLASDGDHAAAYEWLDRVLKTEDQWNEAEREAIRSQYAQLLRDQSRYERLSEYLADWIAENPTTQNPYAQYLSALIWSDQVELAEKTIQAWLTDARIDGELAQPELAKLNAAVSQAMGQGYNLYSYHLLPEWLEPLAETARFFLRHPHHFDVAQRIVNYSRFTETDPGREIRATGVRLLRTETAKLSLPQIQAFVNWGLSTGSEVDRTAWQQIVTALTERWAIENDMQRRHLLGTVLLSALPKLDDISSQLAFLRRQLIEGPQHYRSHYANQLFATLLDAPWTAKREAEALALLPQLSDAEDAGVRLAVQLPKLYGWTDSMVRRRVQASQDALNDVEKLTRTELREKQAEFLKVAREGVADQLHQAVEKFDEPLKPWLRIERITLHVQLGQDLDDIAQRCREYLGDSPPVNDKSTEPYAEALRQRYFITLANLAARRNAPPERADFLMKYLDAGIAAEPEELGWKLGKYQLLVALDRPQELEAALRDWLRTAELQAPWQIALGVLLAEQGKIAEAIELFEAADSEDGLGPAEHALLSGWYQVLDRREQSEAARVKMFLVMEEWQMSNWLSQRLRPWQRNSGELPSELDTDVRLMFRALFQKSQYPQNYLGQLQSYYRASHDFRLLGDLPAAVVGQTAEQVYPFLTGMRNVLEEIRDEATADPLLEQLREVRAATNSATDLRALDLLEALVERRSAEVENQPGPHVDAALAALRRAFDREWAPGEERLMADFLAGLGSITQELLAAEQLRQLDTLYQRLEPGKVDRLHVGHALAQTHWAYARRDTAVQILEIALREYRQALDNAGWPTHANDTLATFVSYLEQQRHYARGENVLQQELEHPVNTSQEHWLNTRLDQLYHSALENGGQVSLGSGPALFSNLERRIIDAMQTTDDNRRYNLINRLIAIYRTAHDQKIDDVAASLRQFAFADLPLALTRQHNNHQSIISQVAQTLREIIDSRVALEFCITRLEHEPARLRYANQDGWITFGHYAAHYRTEVQDLGDLEPRLLKLVLAELRRDLEGRDERSRHIYHKHYSYFWSEKQEQFAAVAEEFLMAHQDSPSAVEYVATYFFEGLDRHDRGIAILLNAYSRQLLAEQGQSRLVRYLHLRSRYEESIPILQALIKKLPIALHYRTQLMHAYSRIDRRQELLAMLKETDALFHEDGRWTEDVMAQLAESCLENALYQQSAEYYEELIPLHERTHVNRGVGNGTLAWYYRNQAEAYARLGSTTKAVDAAASAIVAWGPDNNNRQQALDALKNVLRQSNNLDEYVAQLDIETKKTGQDRPVVRKALGEVYAERQNAKAAATQFQLALELQPNDAETMQALIEVYDQMGDQSSAIAQLLELAQWQSRDITIYKQLAERYTDRPKQRERAYTSIVEVQPNEAESHSLLAEIRESQDRWDEAITEWRQVVRLRSLEPTGLVKLVEAQLHQEQWDAARQTLDKLRSKTWPARFTDVPQRIRDLERRLEAAQQR